MPMSSLLFTYRALVHLFLELSSPSDFVVQSALNHSALLVGIKALLLLLQNCTVCRIFN